MVRWDEAKRPKRSELSEDRATRYTGGDIGWLRRGGRPAKWGQAVTGVVQLRAGARLCHGKLEEAEGKIEMLLKDAKGEPALDGQGRPKSQPLPPPEDEGQGS